MVNRLTLPEGCKGLLLIDVDGPLNPWHNKPYRRPEGYTTYRWTLAGTWVTGRDVRRYKGIRVWLNPTHGCQILALAAETALQPVWATTWLDDANRLIGPSIGLPELPVIRFPDSAFKASSEKWVLDGPWKYSAVSDYAADLPLAWWDDEHDLRLAASEVMPGADRRTFLAARTAARVEFDHARRNTATLLCQVDPKTGLTVEHFDQVRSWAAALPSLPVPSQPNLLQHYPDNNLRGCAQ